MRRFETHHRAALVATASALAMGLTGGAAAALPPLPHAAVDGALSDVSQVSATATTVVQGTLQGVDGAVAGTQATAGALVGGAGHTTRRATTGTHDTTVQLVGGTQHTARRVVASVRHTVTPVGAVVSRVSGSTVRTVGGTRRSALGTTRRVGGMTGAMLRRDVRVIRAGVASILADTAAELGAPATIRTSSPAFGTYAVSWTRLLGCWSVDAGRDDLDQRGVLSAPVSIDAFGMRVALTLRDAAAGLSIRC